MDKIRVKLIRSISGRKKSHIGCVKGLGLRKIGSEVLVDATPENIGMIKEINYLVEVEENVA